MEDVTRVADKPFRSAFCLVLCLRGFGSASTPPIDRGNGLIEDNALSFTWQSNANLAANSFGMSGGGNAACGYGPGRDEFADYLGYLIGDARHKNPDPPRSNLGRFGMSMGSEMEYSGWLC